jgi:hypothetical protein
MSDERWLLWFADPDKKPEHFSGHGAEEAARRRFDQARMAWTCWLFRTVESPALETRTAPEAPEQTWTCVICGRSNYVTVTHCEQCEYSRMVTREGRLVLREGR